MSRIEPHVGEFAVGVTTAPRPVMTLGRTLASLRATGFHPIVCAEPNTEVPGGSLVIRRPELLGCWRNYVATLKDLLRIFPRAQAIGIFQDDVVVAQGIRQFLTRDLWPSPTAGMVSVYASEEDEMGDAIGVKYKGSRAMGICGAFFPRDVAEALVTPEHAAEWRGCYDPAGYVHDPTKKKSVDAWLTTCLSKMNRGVYYYHPSMTQHIADTSAVGHGGRRQRRQTSQKLYRMSVNFIGEDVDVNVARQTEAPLCRWSLPQGHQRYVDAGLVPPQQSRGVSVVIPGFGLPQLTIAAIQKVDESVGLAPEIVYVDNGSEPAELQQIKEFHRTHFAGRLHQMTVVEMGRNAGWTAANNAGIAAANKDHHVLLLNNDTYIGKHCIARLRYHAERHPQIAALGPVTGDDGNQSLTRQRIARAAKFHHDVPTHRYNAETESLLTRQLIDQVGVLSGFCMLLTRPAIDLLGPLTQDPAFEVGLGADDEWCIRANRAGWKCVVVYNAWCAHLHKATFAAKGINRGLHQRRAQQRLEEIK